MHTAHVQVHNTCLLPDFHIGTQRGVTGDKVA